MTENTLPEIDICIDKYSKGFEPSLHLPSKYAKRKQMINQRYDWIKYSVLTPNTPINQFVRISLSNKTALFKRRSIPNTEEIPREILAPLQGHQTRKVVIIKPSLRTVTQPGFTDLTTCKSQLNPKFREKKGIAFDIVDRLPNPVNRRRYHHHRSLMDISSVQSGSPIQIKSHIQELEQLCPWSDQTRENQKENLLVYR